MAEADLSASQANRAVLEAGTPIGEYVLGDVVGRGTFTAVHKAHHPRLDRHVAIKFVLPEFVRSRPVIVKRFLREIDLVKNLEHPNIIRLYDFGQTDGGLPWMATELLSGRTLEEEIESCGSLSMARARHITQQILSALVEAHSFDIVHRDIKPRNVMLTLKGADEDSVVLLDFGIGKSVSSTVGEVEDDLSREHAVAGTPRYMAPELFADEGVGPHTDVYSVGLLMYEMLTGRTAVPGSTVYEVVKHVFEGPPLSMPEPYTNSDVAALLRAATALKPEQRLSSAMAFYQALRENYDEAGNVVQFVDSADWAAVSFDEVVPPPLPQSAPTDDSTRPSTGPPGARKEDVVHRDYVLKPRRKPLFGTGGPAEVLLLAMALGILLLGVGIIVLAVVAWDDDQPPAEAILLPGPLARAAVDDARTRAIVEARAESIALASQGTPTAQPPAETGGTPTNEVLKTEPEDDAPAEPEVAPALVRITLQTRPPGARVANSEDEVVCRRTPCRFDLAQGLEPTMFTLKRRGFNEQEVEVVPRSEQTIKVALTRDPTAKRVRAPTTKTKKGRRGRAKVNPFNVKHH